MIDAASGAELARRWKESSGAAPSDVALFVNRLFTTSAPVADEEMAAFDDGLIEALADEGLIGHRDGGWAGRVRLSTWADLVFAHDPSDSGSLVAETVTGLNPTTRTLAALTPRRPVQRALDVGTGCGAHALLAAARHADDVVATDLNPRAVWFTALNARLNGLDNVEAREGSLFEPVDGEVFDLVVANLPFVISPETDYVFRDSGLPGDEISRVGVRSAAAAMAVDGYAALMCNWIVGPDEPWSAQPLRWIGDLDVSMLVLHHRSETPREYAEKWNSHLLRDHSDDYQATVDRWAAYHGDLGATAIANGAIVLHRRAGRRDRLLHSMDTAPRGNGGAQIERIFDAAALDLDIDLRQGVLAAIAPHELLQRLRYESDGYTATNATLVLDDTAGITGQVTPGAVNVVLRLDGLRPLGELCAEAAAATGLDVVDLETDAIDVCAELLRRGVLEWRGLAD